MIQNGTDFSCTVQVRNTAQRTSTVNITAVISTIEYTGKMKALVKRVKMENVEVDVGKCMYDKHCSRALYEYCHPIVHISAENL